ncbi:MAG TPA: glutamate-cysteine ligase family protein [Gemmatimonadaceae bacterium]
MRRLVEPLFQTSTPAAHPDGSMGAELELIPIRDASLKRVGIAESRDGSGSADVVRDAATAHSWRETVDSYGAPSWITPEGGRICYEPGGQIEISSPVFQSRGRLEHFLHDIVVALREFGGRAGITLLTTGVDPYNTLEQVPLELHALRYDAMTRYFDSIGPSGARMMRQTASLQVSVELGAHAMDRWALLNALAPYLIAAYANSPKYAGHTTGYASYRARLWQTLDPTRTGLPFDSLDPVGRYARFASGAGRIVDDDSAHLTTLFPEVRPRRYFEIRSMDSMEPGRVGEALRFVSGLIHDADVAREAMRVMRPPDATLLARAAKLGRSDRLIEERLNALERLADASSDRTR